MGIGKRMLVGFLGFVLVVGILTANIPNVHAVSDVSIVPSQEDGTPDWNNDDLPGNDSGPKNNIIRTNDLLLLKPELTSNGASTDNVTLEIDYPRGIHVSNLPAYCGVGSTLTPESIPEPGINLDDKTWLTLPE